MTYNSTSDHGMLRGISWRLVNVKTVADTLPNFLTMVLTNGKIAAAVLLAVYLVFVSLWLPFWLLSFLITEWGVYALTVGTIFLIGRAIIRLIAFPGASQKVTTEIEVEFAKYSVRMLTAAAGSVADVATLLAPIPEQDGQQVQLDSRASYELPMRWRRLKSYRDRVLGTYADVLQYFYQQESSSDPTAPELTKYCNNRLSGDVGDLMSLTSKARLDGRELLNRLQNILGLLDVLEQTANSALESGRGSPTEEARATAKQLLDASNEFRDFVSSLKPPSADGDVEEGGTVEDPTDAVRRRIEEQNAATAMEAAKTGLASILPMLDPPPHTSIFGFDVQRGCMLSRYRGSRQLWCPRPGGGMIDVLHFPAIRDGVSIPGNKKAVLYCSPNAGLIEVVAGMSFSGGNVPGADRENSHDDSWVDYYTESGFDVYAFNYAGYGRSFGTTMCVRSRIEGDRSPGCFARVLRIFRGAFFTFQPTPETLRADGVAVGQHLLSSGGVEQLIVHGESIGGLAASGLARHLSTSPSFGSKVSLLVCDRTFCNLEAVAQRLVGGWSGYAIRCLAPFWNTDVAGDFLASSCPKVVANDAADVIISDAASLKSGIALWKELHRGIAPTKGIGWITETPLQYRMAEWENVCVTDSKYVPGNVLFRSQAPVWPNDKLVSFDEAFHFAACCKRIGKFAKAASRAMPRGEEEEGIGLGDLTLQPLVMQAWVALACCDGLTGATLGIAARRGFDATVAWLCSCLVFGGQSVVSRAEKRMQEHQDSLGSMKIVPEDFEGPKAFGTENGSAAALLPISIPVVLERLVSFLEAGDDTMCQLSHEFQFVVGMLHYIQARLSAPSTIEYAQRSRQGSNHGVGSFLNLHCGHNNPFLEDERVTLKSLLDQATANSIN